MQPLRLVGASNFRSLRGLPTVDGRVLAEHWLLRSDALHELVPGDWAVLTALGLRAVCDLRSDAERARRPNHLPMQVRQVPMSMVADIRSDPQYAAILREQPDVAGAAHVMHAIYRRLPSALAPHLRALFGLLHSCEVPLLIHCAAGKDRTGFAVALVLRALGVEPEAIIDDYRRSSLTNRTAESGYLEKMSRQTHEAIGEACSPEMIAVLLDARPAWLEAAFDVVVEEHGGVECYLQKSAGLDAAALARLRDAWLS